MAVINFDPRAVAPDAGNAGPVPDGWYTLIGKKFEVEPTSSGTGIKLSSRFEIVAPPEFKGGVVFHNFNLKNDSEKAQQIGQGQLSALCHAVGMGNQVVSDTSMIEGRPFNARLVRIQEDGYQPKNEIKAFRSMQEACTLGPSGGAAKAGHTGAAAPAPAPAAWAPASAPPVPAAAPMAAAPQPAYAPAPAPAYAPPAAPAAAPAQPAWQPPAAAQPWAQPDPNAGVPPQQYQAPVAQAPAPAMPDWAHQQPVAAPAQAVSGAPAPTSTLAPTPEAQAALHAPVPWGAPPQQ